MAEILIEDRDCEACGKEVRKGALFCYHCGASVAPEIASASGNKAKTNGTAAKRKKAKNAENEILAEKEDIHESAEEEKTIKETESGQETAAKEETKLKTAAELRKKPKLIKKKRVEVVWEQPENPPNVRFLIVTLLIGGFALALWLVARYLG